MKISLGPIQYHWPADKVKHFYRQIRDWPVDTVYLGEVICSKREELSLLDWLYIADMLTEAGKEVVLSTLVHVETTADLKFLTQICDNGDYKIEANSESAIRMAFGRPFVAGASLNNCKKDVLKDLEYYGAVRWVMPIGLSGANLRNISETRPAGMQIEVLVYGGLPMSFSSNCITAMAHHLTTDTCELVCKKYNEGMELSNKDVEDTLIVNGFQIQAGRPCNLINEVDNLKSAGVDVIRISPQLNHTKNIVENFSQALNGKQIDENFISTKKWCNEYWYAEEKLENHVV